MTTVVAGANGLVGSRIAAQLAEGGERVVAVGRGPRRLSAAAEYVEIDLLRDREALARLIASWESSWADWTARRQAAERVLSQTVQPAASPRGRH